MSEHLYTAVWVNGCFDVLHPGHIDLLEQAAEMGDWLIVGINSDESVRGLKGNTKPIMSLRHRIIMLNSVDVVSQVVVIHGKRCTPELRALRPHVVVKGSGYTKESMCQDERKAVEEYGGELRFIDCHYPISTSDIISRCKQCN